MAMSISEMRKKALEAYKTKHANAPIEEIETCRNKGVTHERPENLPNALPVNNRKLRWEDEEE